MSFFIFATCVALHVALGARPGRDWEFQRHSLEVLRDDIQRPSQTEAASLSRERQLVRTTPSECRDLKDRLQELGIHGEGDPCSWEGLECSSECQLSSLVRDGNVAGTLATLRKLTGLKTLKLRNAKVSGHLKLLRPLKKLQSLDLRSTEVSGDVATLSALAKLKEVNLGNTAVTGSFWSLASLSEMWSLDLSYTQTGGDFVPPPQSLPFRLRFLFYLDLSGTGIAGDLASLKDVPFLRHLHTLKLRSAKVKGSLASLRSLGFLLRVDLSNTQVKGELKDLQHPNLVVLQLGNTKVQGKVSVLENMAALQILDLDNTIVDGNLDFVQKLPALRSLHLHNSDVEGDFSSLRTLTNLQEVRLSNTNLVGSLQSFDNLTQLRVLKLYSTEVLGNLTSLHHLHDLHVLGFSNTKVAGELKDLEHFQKLQLAHLDNTQMEGDLEVLQNLTSLRALCLRKSNVFGDITVLRNFGDLKYLDLAYTSVHGDTKALQELTDLDKVYLTATKVTGSLTTFQNFTRLERLDLGNARVDGNLSSLQSITSLKLLSLSGANVTGDIKVLLHMKSLKELFLGKMKVYGNVNTIPSFEALQVAFLENTGISGWIEPTWWTDCCRHLKELNLADTRMGPLKSVHGVVSFSTQKPLLQALNSLNVSGCQLNGSIEDLLLPLAGSGISVLMAAGCNLTGEVPNIAAMKAKVDGFENGAWRSALYRSLQILDLSANNLTSVPAVIASVRMDLHNNKMPLTLPAAMIKQAVHHRTELWLGNTTLANRDEMQPLVSNELRLRDRYTRDKGRFSCRMQEDPMIWITPELFLPQAMCACKAGYEGFATNCTPCPVNTYSSGMNSNACRPCPHNSAAPEAFATCVCKIGRIQDKNGTLSCECPVGEAFVDAEPGPERCESCPKLKLECPKAGSNASTAAVQDGYARLQEPSWKVYKCLDSAHCKSSKCAEGYAGRLCADCAEGHHENFGQCKPCIEFENFSAARAVLLGLCGAGVLALLATAAWAIRRRLIDTTNLRLKCAAQLLLPLLGALLQLVQLWSVLGRLARPLEDQIDLSDTNATNVTTDGAEDFQGDPWASCLEVLQLTATEVQGLLALQCFVDAKLVRLVFAIATPLIPLSLLLICCLVEFFTFGTGIQVGLQLLTVLFIGGASGAARLLDCRRLDGTGKISLGDFAFRRLMPHLLCTEAKWVDHVGRSCAFCYGVLIPSFLALLFAKQHLVMRQTKTFVAHYESGRKATLRLQMISDKECIKDNWTEKRLAAAAAVYVAVHLRGRALVTLAKDENAVTVELLQTTNGTSAILESDLSVDLLVQKREEAAVLRSQGETIRHKTLVQMLTEHSILADIELKRSDRIMLGAKQIFCKYASCQFVWMEVCLKLASAALVSVVGSKDGLGLSVAITLGMALMIGVAQPFGRPQQNVLYTFCFACLALAAVGFYERQPWLSHSALLLPVLPLIISLARPDSQEALAMRLHEELDKGLQKGPVQVSTDRVQFF